MKPQPKNAVEGYAYFLCLVKDDGLRVKQGTQHGLSIA